MLLVCAGPGLLMTIPPMAGTAVRGKLIAGKSRDAWPSGGCGDRRRIVVGSGVARTRGHAKEGSERRESR